MKNGLIEARFPLAPSGFARCESLLLELMAGTPDILNGNVGWGNVDHPGWDRIRRRSMSQWLDPEECSTADPVLLEWALTDDEARRFDAVATIDGLQIVCAVQAGKSTALQHRRRSSYTSLREPIE